MPMTAAAASVVRVDARPASGGCTATRVIGDSPPAPPASTATVARFKFVINESASRSDVARSESMADIRSITVPGTAATVSFPLSSAPSDSPTSLATAWRTSGDWPSSAYVPMRCVTNCKALKGSCWLRGRENATKAVPVDSKSPGRMEDTAKPDAAPTMAPTAMRTHRERRRLAWPSAGIAARRDLRLIEDRSSAAVSIVGSRSRDGTTPVTHPPLGSQPNASADLRPHLPPPRGTALHILISDSNSIFARARLRATEGRTWWFREGKCGKYLLLPYISPSGKRIPFDNPGYSAPRWITTQFAQFAAATATHYLGQIDMWAIWNEPDIPRFWAQPDAAAYAELRQAVYSAIKSVSSNATVVTAAYLYSLLDTGSNPANPEDKLRADSPGLHAEEGFRASGGKCR